MSDVNKVILVGRAGRDPEVREEEEGRVGWLSVSTRNPDPGEVAWHRVRFTGDVLRMAEQFVSRGDRLYIEGRIIYGAYVRDGVTIPTAEVLASEMVLLGRRS